MSDVKKETVMKTTTGADLAVLSPIEDIIEDARNGRMFVLVDDEDRENEGDLVIPAQMATPAAINFMAKYGRGLICLTLTPKRADELGLRLMPQSNASRFGTAFTVSIEAREGVTTGISAPDRARTVAVAIDPESSDADITTPGHVFPLVCKEGGVLVRAGHTEATVDISRLAGLNPSAVICEIMNEEGEMARLPELIEFAKHHDLKIGAIADLIAYRRRHDHMVRRAEETMIDSAFGGEFKLHVYVNELSYAEHVVLVKGDITHGGPVMVRMHAMNVLEDVLGDKSRGKDTELQKSMEIIGEEGRGVIVLIREPHAKSLSSKVRAKENLPPVDDDEVQDLRDYGVGAQILLDLGIDEMILLSNTDKNIIGLDGYGLKVVERRSID